jgi:rfaE bifunctional protein nucleotidyltransferase chain/domain/rfaE bifunctional protein kinase chain/domain
VVVGDALLDVDVEGVVERRCPDAPAPVVDQSGVRQRPGGAGLAAALAAGDGAGVTLVTALGRDPAGRRLAGLLRAHGVEVIDLGLDGATPEKVRVRAGGQSLVRVDRGGAPESAIGHLPAAARAAMGWADGILVSDYGRGITRRPDVRSAVGEACARGARVVWDPHPNGAEPVPDVTLATPNQDEALRLIPEAGSGLAGALGRASQLCRRWRARHVAVTRGAAGAVIAGADEAARSLAAARVDGGDPCGAGDRFAATAAGWLADGAPAPLAVKAAVESASAFVAAGGATSVRTLEEDGDDGLPAVRPGGGEIAQAERVIASTRRRGGTVVAAGGCFDLLHAGHVETLIAARALGDCLVVCLNSDASVRRLKGPGRPLVSQVDRAALLSAMACVDAVAVFDEDTPEAVLDHLRPDVWAKGGDYAGAELPEAAVLARWGGRAVVLPFLPGHSTSRLIEEVMGNAAG